MEQFKYGEEVLVRNDEREDWSKRVYVGTLPNCDRHWAMSISQHPGNFDGLPWPWRQIRKIQKPETEPLFISTQGVFTAEEAVMQLQERIEKILEELKELKTQIK